MAKKYRHKKMKTGLVVLIVCVGLVLAGLAAYLITNHAINKREEKTIAACNEYFTEKLGDNLGTVETYKYSYYGFYVTEVTESGCAEILAAANEGDEAAIEQWYEISDRYEEYSSELSDIVAEIEEDYTSMLYLIDDTSEDESTMLVLYDGSVYSDALEYVDEEEEEEETSEETTDDSEASEEISNEEDSTADEDTSGEG